MTIESTIQRLTNDGEIVVQFLVDVIQGSSYDATLNHRLKSAEWLAALGGTIPEDAIPKSASIRPKSKSKPKQAKTDKQAKRDKKPPVTEKQILHFDIARAIMRQTRDGESIIEFLIRVVAKIERDGENFTPAARMRAARELLLRGWGSFSYTGRRPRIPSGDNEELGQDLARRIREYTGDGGSIVRMLVEALENEDPKAIEKGTKGARPINGSNYYGAVGFNASQRVWVACELLRRYYDVKTDHITQEDIDAYWQSQSAVDHPDGDDYAGVPDIDLLGVPPEQAESAAQTAAVASAHSGEQTAAANTDIWAVRNNRIAITPLNVVLEPDWRSPDLQPIAARVERALR